MQKSKYLFRPTLTSTHRGSAKASLRMLHAASLVLLLLAQPALREKQHWNASSTPSCSGITTLASTFLAPLLGYLGSFIDFPRTLAAILLEVATDYLQRAARWQRLLPTFWQSEGLSQRQPCIGPVYQVLRDARSGCLVALLMIKR